MNENQPIFSEKRKQLKKLIVAAIPVFLLLVVQSLSVYAWLVMQKQLSAYAPIASPEALYIGAGHRDIENDTFEDIRYLYFYGIDAGDTSTDYYDYVFCVFGKDVPAYKLQLAYTTNNQFNYAVFPAEESDEAVPNVGAVEYVTHTTPPATYYYYVEDRTSALTGSFLNAITKTDENGKTLTLGDPAVNDTYYDKTYDDYTSVNPFAVPLYWQMDQYKIGSRGDFCDYYILRIYTNGKTSNDRETDVICISAKSVTPDGEG